MHDDATVFIGLGANLGDARTCIEQATAQLAAWPGIDDFVLSPLYRSAPVDSSGPDYVNAVAQFATRLSARDVLRILQGLELAHGRLRPYRNAPRTLDLDLLLYGTQDIREPDLIVPHPRMHERAFVLRPLADLAPTLRLAQGPIATLLADCSYQELSPLPD
ncbi:2-amino-4-hydroxy-6-hydroxymethyldihydropteridine diphosphokinase [Pollutimonas nitritireducens]|uniref:2-amino-4-hydroxy-6-hydroxymethyldihydropteridine pyrophosphokinase n=1 Tax=Pollutimonas nitritireducens TaxID=2045209 RepID=A0A2N4UK55_9BURK|nr:2-amino-4-hydroxy-6-hydroxymethyldihydropteridine diphosphokinase [Pollutimonas nitritireducens]PLC55390.1 2-amino-4-hydroxy-6-hydroxymethyldihydropteridine diphosphokinase [Pollutimonas nitritireducens]